MNGVKKVLKINNQKAYTINDLHADHSLDQDQENDTLSNVYAAQNVTTYAKTSTANAYIEIQKIPDEEEKKRKEIQLNNNWKKISQHESYLKLIDSFIAFAPTFVFGVLGYSFISTPENWQIATLFLAIFMLVIAGALIGRTKNQNQLYFLGRAQDKLKDEIKK